VGKYKRNGRRSKMTNYVITVYRTVQQRAEVEFSTNLPLEIDESIIKDNLIDLISIATDNVGEGEWQEVELDGPYDFDLNAIGKA
jgi:acetoacetate decarboxylase